MLTAKNARETLLEEQTKNAHLHIYWVKKKLVKAEKEIKTTANNKIGIVNNGFSLYRYNKNDQVVCSPERRSGVNASNKGELNEKNK